MTRRVAFVTGASRGIGKACAVHLARAGFDVAVTARTVRDGEEREHSSTVRRSDTRPLPGSLTATAEERARRRPGGARLAGRPPRPGVARRRVATVQERWGGVDVLVNNGRYMDRATWTISSTRRPGCSTSTSRRT